MSFQTRLLLTHDTSNDSVTGQLDVDLLEFNRLDSARYPFLLSSTAARENNTHYDILLAFPRYQLSLNADKTLELSPGDADVDIDASTGFLDNLESLFLAEREASSNDSSDQQSSTEIPFSGGWFV